MKHHRSDLPSFRREKEDKSHLRCTHYGGTRHTKEGCFKLIGFPEWWNERRPQKTATKAQTNQTGGKANMATGVLHQERMSDDQATHSLEPRTHNNGDKGETVTEEGEGDDGP